jgi:hypothetical protein
MSEFSQEPLLLERRLDHHPTPHRGALRKILESRAYAVSALVLNLGVAGGGSYIGVSSLSRGEVIPGLVALIAVGASTLTLQDVGDHLHAIFDSSRRGE